MHCWADDQLKNQNLNAMKKGFLLSLLSLFSLVASSQVLTPSTSSKATVEQQVGLTQVEIDYSRPNMRGRLIYGDLVPYGKLWRTGANMNTIVRFDNDVTIDGKALAKGSYALYTIPKVSQWEVIFYKDTNNWGLPEQWDESLVALSTSAKVIPTERRAETFTIAVNNVNSDYADLDLRWENTLVSVRFYVPTDELAMASIEETFAGPKVVDYYAAAEYYFLSDKDPNQALVWIQQAIEKSAPSVPYYFVRLKSQILAKLGDFPEAIQTAKQALELSKAANNVDYIKINQDAIKQWSSELK